MNSLLSLLLHNDVTIAIQPAIGLNTGDKIDRTVAFVASIYATDHVTESQVHEF